MKSLSPKLMDFRFSHTLRVRWAEVDMQKIVFNGHYLMYFDTAVAEYWRASAVPYEDTMHRLGGDLYVVRSTIEYKASARYDDQLQVCLRCERMGTSSITFQGAIFCAGKLLVTGELVYVYADPRTQKSMPMAQPLRDLFTNFEAGHAMTHVQTGDWKTLSADALALRLEVFVHEQGVPEELEQDEWDARALHAVVFNSFDMPIATGRLIQTQAGVSRIGRMAVKRVMRGSGVGRQVLEALLDIARQRGDRQVLLHAQLSAQDFYAKLGFIADGTIFEEAGIAHVTMQKTFA